MRTLLRACVAAAFVVAVVAAHAFEKPAAEILSAAKAKAKAEKKNVLVSFHASWCGWCKRFDAFVADPEMRKLLEANYVLVSLDVLESADKKHLENPGGQEVMEKLGGKDAGLPFFAIVDPSGKLLINSNEKDGKAGNVGYPVAPNEIGHFMKMLEATAPRLTDAQRGKIKQWLEAKGKTLASGGSR